MVYSWLQFINSRETVRNGDKWRLPFPLFFIDRHIFMYLMYALSVMYYGWLCRRFSGISLTYSQNGANVDYRGFKFISSLSGLITVIIIKFASKFA